MSGAAQPQGTPGQQKLPTVVKVNHPDSERFFRESAPSKKALAEARKQVLILCSGPGCSTTSDDQKMLKCAKCEQCWYCSKECQIQDWSHHRSFCRKNEDPAIRKLWTNLITNPLLKIHSVHGDSAPRNRAVRCNQCCQLDDGANLPSNPKEIEGMVQIYCTNCDVNRHVTPAPNRMEIWRNERERLKAQGHANAHVIILEIKKGNNPQVVALTMPIPPEVLKVAEKRPPFQYRSAMTGKTTYAPMNATTCIEYINKDIRADRYNKYKLRTPMTAADFVIIQEGTIMEGDNLSPADSEGYALRSFGIMSTPDDAISKNAQSRQVTISVLLTEQPDLQCEESRDNKVIRL
ncbi:MYND-type zinc finger protein samB [Abortiporus biennis]